MSKLTWLKLDYVRMAGGDNHNLPQWMNFKILNGVLHIFGSPTDEWIGRHLKIQILDQSDFIL